ncbi:MAG: hypothetical protein M3280_09570 [Actinomycetota bacterium]|nr:hypothetical protein [Actinomycetota bacterium]
MRTKPRMVAVVIGILALLVCAGPAYAYPRKSVLTAAGWNCWKNDGTYFLLTLTEDDRYGRSQPVGGQGTYRYNRDAGKVNFRSGPMEDLFGKLSQGLGGWDMRVKRDSTGATWGNCQNYTAGGM